MNVIINRDEAPIHLFRIVELDFSGDLFAERLSGQWFRLGARTITPHRNKRGVEDVVSRKSLLLVPEHFADIFDKLNSVGNVIHNMGKPEGLDLNEGNQKKYSYSPFHKFEFPFTSTVGEPLVFEQSATSGVQLFINPDLWLFFELEEKTRGCGIWWDQRRGVEALRQHTIEEDNLEVVEIRVNHLRKYLQARQMSLIVCHYRQLLLFNPSQDNIRAFEQKEEILGSPEQGVKAFLQNWGLRNDIPDTPPFLQRRLNLWFEIRPPAIDIEDLCLDEPPFDPYTFTLPTRVGPVAPARWARFRSSDGRTFEGNGCDFMEQVYFLQEVLTKYEGASGFDIKDNGSVLYHHYRGLDRSTVRLGNELLSISIGDFAQHLPFEEWRHWEQYSVEPPSHETVAALEKEQTIPDAVNSLVKVLHALNVSFAYMAKSLGIENLSLLWCGSLDSLAGRQLKWVYPSTADDEEFLKRATLTSTLVLDPGALKSDQLRKLIKKIGENLHMNDEKSLGSRKLLQKATLIAVLIEKFRPDISEIPSLLKQAEGKATGSGKSDLQDELKSLYKRVWDEFTPLALLYDLRTCSGLAHQPNKKKFAAAIAQLGFPEKNWHRTHYLSLLNLIKETIHQISEHLNTAGDVIMDGGLFQPKCGHTC